MEITKAEGNAMKKVVGSIIVILVILIIGLVIWINVSPMPAVYLLRRQMGEASISYPEDEKERKSRVAVENNLVYESNDRHNTYDLYMPKDIEGKVPVVIWIHGGAFVAGSATGVENWGYMLASEGIAVVSMDYQWAPEMRYPGQARQVQECIMTLQKRAAEGLAIDLEQVILAGDSAGAHIAAQSALINTNPEYATAIGLQSALNPGDIKAMLLYCGPYDVEKMLNIEDKALNFFASRIGWSLFGSKNWKENPLLETTVIKNYLTKDFPSSFVTDGNNGSFESQGKELVEKMNALNIENHALFFDKEVVETNHEYQTDLLSKEGWQCYEETVQFLKEQQLIK